MEFLKVEGMDGLFRDTSNQAILNNNSKEYETYIARRDAAKAQKQELERQGKELQDVKSEISEIKHMLQILINKQ
jgi:hypothetical protein